MFGLDGFELAKDWLPKLVDKLISIRATRKAELEALTDVFGDPLQLAKFYIEPSCQQLNPADYEEDANIVREPIFDRIQAFCAGDPGRANRHMFILSDAGMGKTSALLMFKLAHLTSFWPQDLDCVLLKLGRSSLSEIAKLKNKNKTILLLDGLDEDPHAWRRVMERLAEILAATSSFRRVIVTCRTQFFAGNDDPFNRRGQVEVGGYICPTVYTSLFSDRQVTSYLRNRYPERIGDAAWEARVSRLLAGMGFLRMRPMLLAHIDDLLESEETDWNEYSIYHALISSWLLREQRKATNPPIDYAKKLRRACTSVAAQMLRSSRQYFTADETANITRIWRTLLGFDRLDLGGRSLLNKDSDGNFRFSHFSIQECLAMEYLLENQLPTDMTDVPVTDFMNRLAGAWIRNSPGVRADGRNFRAFDLSGQDFSATDLRRINFGGARLANVRFFASNLSGASLKGANLTSANLGDCILDEVNLSGSNLGGANLRGARGDNVDFSASNLEAADLTETDFVNSSIRAAKYSSFSTKWPSPTTLRIAEASDVEKPQK